MILCDLLGLKCNMKYFLPPQYNLNILFVSPTGQSEGHWKTQRNAGDGKLP